MPLRRYMTEHGLPSWYSWLVVVLLPILTAMGVLVVALRVNERSIDRERAAREQAQRQTDAALCSVFAPLDDSYSATPPATAAGKAFAVKVAAVRRQVCH